MRELTASNTAEYLRHTGRVPSGASIDVRELTGGVSNVVLRVDISGRPPLVIKQCRERLRVAMEWHARLERIWTEQAAMELLGAILPAGTVPLVEFDDRANYLFAMTCAPDDAVTWKSQLMAGLVDVSVASRLGILLATIHDKAPALLSFTAPLSRSPSTLRQAQGPSGASLRELQGDGRKGERRQWTVRDAAAAAPSLTSVLADTSLFDELRVDPYYRTVARAHADLKPQIDDLIDAMARLPSEKRTLVLGDFSPKNILVHQQGLILLDFECAHSGDPAFDLGFFLTHLLLKRIRAEVIDRDIAPRFTDLATTFLNSYLNRRELGAPARADLTSRTIRHTAACCLARVDGKSPVEYLDECGQTTARAFARDALRTEPPTWDALLDLLSETIERTNACQSP